MLRARALVLLVCLVSVAASGCAAGTFASKAMPAAAMAPAEAAAPPPPLDHSLFARNPDGTISEDDLQKVLDSPIELELPARIGVLPVMNATDWRGPNPDFTVPAGVGAFARAMRASELFTLVTEIMPIPSGALGMEALRAMAARYRLRYVVLYREVYVRQERSNAWTWGYASVLGAFFLPGQTLRVGGYLEASMFDVKTGLLMFTVRRAVSARRESNLWHIGDKLAAMEATLAERFAPELAQDVWSATTQLTEAIRVEDERRAGKATAPAAAAALD
jgi:hypothetical protein